jgi:hypothetical protein
MADIMEKKTGQRGNGGFPVISDPDSGATPVRSDRMIHAFSEKPGKIFLLYGDRSVFQLSLQMAAHAMAKEKPIAVVDGCNRFDVHALSRFARARKIDPGKFLSRIFISRGFTCYQMEQAIACKLPEFLRRIHSATALVFGLLDTFYDEQAPLHEVKQILQRLIRSLHDMKADGISVLLVCTERSVSPPERNRLFTTLRSCADRVYRLNVGKDDRFRLFLEPQPALRRSSGAAENARIPPPSRSLTQGDRLNGTHSTDFHKPDRFRAGKLVKIPPRAAQGRPGNIR